MRRKRGVCVVPKAVRKPGPEGTADARVARGTFGTWDGHAARSCDEAIRRCLHAARFCLPMTEEFFCRFFSPYSDDSTHRRQGRCARMNNTGKKQLLELRHVRVPNL
jgi:hypothetical protein